MRDRVKFFLIFGISLLLIGCIGMSFALFTTDTERKGALNIIVANTSCPLESDELDENNQIILNGGESKEITVKLTNSSVMPVHSIITYTSGIEDIKIYYIGSNVDELENDNLEIGENKTYRLVVENNNNSTQTITVNARCGLANKDLTLNENEKTINELYDPPVDLSKVPLMKTWIYSKSYVIPPGEDTPTLVVTLPSEDFHQYYEKITNITFSNKLEEPEETINRWDVSEAGDGRVMAYMLNDEENPGNYKVIIAGDGGVYANPKHDMFSSGEEYPGLLRRFSNLKKMDVTYLNVSQLTDLSYMFGRSDFSLNSFDGFAGTELIGLETWDVSKVTSMSYMFYQCSQLSSVGDLSGWDTSNVTTMNNMFSECIQLTDLSSLANWTMSSVKDMSQMFSYCSQLTDLDLSSWDTSSVTNMSSIFSYCTELSSVGDLSKWTTSHVTDMSVMFTGCSRLQSLDLSEWDTKSVTNMNSMFSGCNKLTSLDLSGWYTSNVKTMYAMFYECSQLSDLSSISNWDTSQVTNMSYMFNNCSNLKSVGNLSGWDTSSVTDMSYMFAYCSQLSTTITIRGNVTSYGNMFSSAATAEGASIIVNYIDDNTKTIAEAMVATKYPSTAHVSLGNKVA